MTMNVGQRYRCQNPDCHCEVVVIEPSMEGAFNPQCCCGGKMKKPYTKPTFKKLDFKPVDSGRLVKNKELASLARHTFSVMNRRLNAG